MDVRAKQPNRLQSQKSLVLMEARVTPLTARARPCAEGPSGSIWSKK
jgi:hypothetical protein